MSRSVVTFYPGASLFCLPATFHQMLQDIRLKLDAFTRGKCLLKLLKQLPAWRIAKRHDMRLKLWANLQAIDREIGSAGVSSYRFLALKICSPSLFI